MATRILLIMLMQVAVAHAAVISISGVQTQIAGSTTDVPGSGSPSNFDGSTTVGDFAVFDVTRDAVDYADLRVTYAGDIGGNVGSDIMIARTTNSQGLTDTGTLSILIDIGAGSGRQGVTIQFDWFTPGSFVGGVEQPGSSLLSDIFLYTTFDIDFRQFVAMETNDLQSVAINDGTSLLTVVDRNPYTSLEDGNANSTFDDPDTAGQFLTTGASSSHLAQMGKQTSDGAALFMFEFRDPSIIVPTFTPDTTIVPEPSSVIGLAVLLLGGALLRRQLRG